MIIRKPKAIAIVPGDLTSGTGLCWRGTTSFTGTNFFQEKTNATAVSQTNNDGVRFDELFSTSTSTDEINYIAVTADRSCLLAIDLTGASWAGIDISSPAAVDYKSSVKLFVRLSADIEKVLYLPTRYALTSVKIKGYCIGTMPVTYWEVGMAYDGASS